MTDHTPAEIVEPTGLVITQMQPGLAVEANFEALQAHIEQLVADYRDIEVKPEYLQQAKKDRAYLNSVSKALNDRRKEVKAAYMRPVIEFENQVKVLDAPIREASIAIDQQVKAIEEQERLEKRGRLQSHYNDFAGALADAVPFEKVEQVAWLNKSYSLMQAFSDIEGMVERIVADEKTLSELELSHPTEAKAEYFATLDLSKAIARSKAIDAQIARAEELEARKAAYAAEQAAPKAETPVCEAPAVDTPPVVSNWLFYIACTDEDRDKIVSFLKSIGISGRVTRGEQAE